MRFAHDATGAGRVRAPGDGAVQIACLAEVVNVAGGGVTQPDARLSLIERIFYEESSQREQVGVGQGVIHPCEVVAFSPFSLHCHGRGKAEQIEKYLGQVVVDVFNLARS
jgi:hypothetical protein